MIKLFNDDKVLMDFLEYDDVKESQLEMFEGGDITGSEKDERNTERRVQEQISRSKKLKDKGQRECCGCIISKDIGQYDTCNHQCIYCYANTSPKVANNNYKRYLASTKNDESII
jgi:sulfatase maturation enzyme AslB (radical SAM superfamily)